MTHTGVYSLYSNYLTNISMDQGKYVESSERHKQAKWQILKLRADLRRAEEHRDILKKTARYLASQSGQGNS